MSIIRWHGIPLHTIRSLSRFTTRCEYFVFEYLCIILFNLAIFLLDAHYEIFVWFGWWWKEEKGDENSITATANSNTTGSRISRWLRDKQLALETAQQYAKGTQV